MAPEMVVSTRTDKKECGFHSRNTVENKCLFRPMSNYRKGSSVLLGEPRHDGPENLRFQGIELIVGNKQPAV